jgi:hypothetical protein
MSGASWDPDDLAPIGTGGSSARVEIDRWLQTMESLLADVADDPELAEPLTRIIASTRARHEEAAERTKRALSSVESLLRETKSHRLGKPGQISDEQADDAIRSLKAAIRRVDTGSDSPGDPSDF